MGNGNLYVEAYYNGGMTGFEIIPHGEYFEVVKDAKVIAVLRCNQTWQQLSGEKLPDDVFESICQQIKKPESQA